MTAGPAAVFQVDKKGTRIGSASPLIASVGRSGRRGLRLGIDRHLAAVLVPELELDHAVDQGKQRVVVGPTDVSAGVELGAPLPDEDVSRHDFLATVSLDAEVLGVAGPAVPAGAYA